MTFKHEECMLRFDLLHNFGRKCSRAGGDGFCRACENDTGAPGQSYRRGDLVYSDGPEWKATAAEEARITKRFVVHFPRRGFRLGFDTRAEAEEWARKLPEAATITDQRGDLACHHHRMTERCTICNPRKRFLVDPKEQGVYGPKEYDTREEAERHANAFTFGASVIDRQTQAPAKRFLVDPPGGWQNGTKREFDTFVEAMRYAEECPDHTRIVDRRPQGGK